MHASKTISLKQNKRIKNSVAYSLQILYFPFKTWELIRRGTEWLKSMLVSLVCALLCVHTKRHICRGVAWVSSSSVAVVIMCKFYHANIVACV